VSAPAYDPVAALYDRAFSNIEVREPEWRWIEHKLKALPKAPRVLEIGCGTGALLRSLAPQVERAVGVDVSREMTQRARARAQGLAHLSFETIAGPELPFAHGQFDLVISFLSFRYLDWTLIWPEIRRVLAPGGRFWLIDLVGHKSRVRDATLLLRSLSRHLLMPLKHPRFVRDLRALSTHPDWTRMLKRHPIRPLSEYAQFFRAELPGARFAALDATPSRRVVALDSGPLP
jgi:SAM-dependent methyltransferase